MENEVIPEAEFAAALPTMLCELAAERGWHHTIEFMKWQTMMDALGEE